MSIGVLVLGIISLGFYFSYGGAPFDAELIIMIAMFSFSLIGTTFGVMEAKKGVNPIICIIGLLLCIAGLVLWFAPLIETVFDYIF